MAHMTQSAHGIQNPQHVLYDDSNFIQILDISIFSQQPKDTLNFTGRILQTLQSLLHLLRFSTSNLFAISCRSTKHYPVIHSQNKFYVSFSMSDFKSMRKASSKSNFPHRSYLVNHPLHLYDAHFGQRRLQKLHYCLKTDTLFYEFLVVAEQSQSNL
jgi:hypothetical protein